MFYNKVQHNKNYQSTTANIVLTASGGMGHLVAAEQELKNYPDKKSLLVDIIDKGWLNFEWVIKQFHFDILPKIPYVTSLFFYNFGKEGVSAWNEAQKTGDLEKLNQLIRKQNLARLAFGKNFYEKMQDLLRNHPQTELVITTQPLGFADIHRAIADFNKTKSIYEKKIELKMVMTDLPSKYAVHFFSSLSLIQDKDLIDARVNLLVPYPGLPIKAPCLFDYHKVLSELCPFLFFEKTATLKHCINIEFNAGPIDKAFLKINREREEKGCEWVRETYRSEPITLEYTERAHQLLLKQFNLKEQFIKGIEHAANTFKRKLLVPKDAEVIVVMLGSQVSKRSTLDVIDTEYKIHKNTALTNKRTYLFVYCGNDTETDSLFVKVCRKANLLYDGGRFIVIPLTNQTHKETIARLFAIANTNTIRGGGMSIMEVETVSTAYVVVFAEMSQKQAAMAAIDPEASLIIWEKGNAYDCQHKLGKDRVAILNQKIYFSGRLNQMNKKYVSLLTASDEGPLLSASYYMEGCDIFKEQEKLYLEHSDKISAYGQAYAKGCELIQNNHTYVDETISQKPLEHPNGWAMRFAEIIFNFVLENDEFEISLEQYNFAKTYVNAFYEPKLKILSNEEASLYAQAYLSIDAPDAQARAYAIEFVKRKKDKKDMVLDKFFHLNLNNNNYLLNYNYLWNQGRTLPERITILFQDYIKPQYSIYLFNTHPYRSKKDEAQEVIDGMVNLRYQSDEDILIYLIKYKEKYSKEISSWGSFMRRLNFAIQMTGRSSLENTKEIVYQHSPYEERPYTANFERKLS